MAHIEVPPGSSNDGRELCRSLFEIGPIHKRLSGSRISVCIIRRPAEDKMADYVIANPVDLSRRATPAMS
jgi:hypothetical protein